jgi:hypothetical protein
MAIGKRLQISYLPDRQIELEYIGENRFRILKSLNSKLKSHDEITITHVVQSYPLLVSEVVRDGKSLGSFTAGKAQGIRFKIL